MLLLLFLGSFTLLTAQTENYCIGKIHQLESKILNESRTLNVHLPINYNQDSTYPVIYVLDGSANEDFLHIAGLVQFFQLQFAMPDFIIVGIANVDRKRDFTFYPKDTSFLSEYPTTGHSDKFIEFIDMELQPFVESTYKTNETKYIIGQSLGGLLATEILLKKRELFSHYFIVSPSLWWDNEVLLKEAPSLLSERTKPVDFVYVAIGADEHIIMRKDAKKLGQVLNKSKGCVTHLEYNKLKDEDHATVLHNAIYQGFEILFPHNDK
ncbi:MAG: alpha/beta hydrolase [Bacteroidota bacterium]